MTIGSDAIPYRWFAKWVGTWSREEKMLRIARLVWANGEPGVPGGGYTAALSLALRPTLFRWRREYGGWILTLFGVRVHYQRSYGGWMV